MRRPDTSAVVSALGWVTLREVIRDKVLYNILILAAFMMGIALLTSQLTFISPSRVVLDFGVSAISLSCAMIAVFFGANVIQREFDRRTVYVSLSHPISRTQFVLGKFAGLSSLLFINWLLVSSVFVAIYYYVARDFYPDTDSFINRTLFIGLFLLLIQSLVLGAMSIFFASFSTVSLSVMMTLGLFLVGNNTSQVRLIAAKMKSPMGRNILESFTTVLPNFEHFNMGTRLTYGIPISVQTVLQSTSYGFLLIGICLLSAGILIKSKEV
jgi:ABC-type transport system involved in multi-copper enzyme maturation permease subunit